MLKNFAFAAVALATIASLAPVTRGQSDDPAASLPEGDGKKLVASVCTQCHGLAAVLDSHRTLSEWKDTVNTMVSNGAPLEDNEIDTVAQYLAKNFGPQAEAKDSGKDPAQNGDK